MKIKPIRLIIIGLILLIGCIVGAIISFYVIIQDPSEVAKETINFDFIDSDYDDFGYSEEVFLSKGEYEIWYEVEFLFIGNPGEVTITDSSGDIIFQESTFFNSDSISRNYHEYHRAGKFTLEDSGNYNISVDNDCTLYITPPVNLELGIGLGILFVIFGIIGVVIMLVGGYLYLTKKSKPLKFKRIKGRAPSPPPYQYPPYHYPPSYYHPPPYPSPPPHYQSQSGYSLDLVNTPSDEKESKTTDIKETKSTTTEQSSPPVPHPPPPYPPYPYYPYYPPPPGSSRRSEKFRKQ